MNCVELWHRTIIRPDAFSEATDIKKNLVMTFFTDRIPLVGEVIHLCGGEDSWEVTKVIRTIHIDSKTADEYGVTYVCEVVKPEVKQIRTLVNKAWEEDNPLIIDVKEG